MLKINHPSHLFFSHLLLIFKSGHCFHDIIWRVNAEGTNIGEEQNINKSF